MGKKLAIEILLAAGVAFVLGIFGPFGTYTMPVGARIAYWVGVGLMGYAIFRPLLIIGHWLSVLTATPAVIGMGLALFLAALPLTFFIAMLMWKQNAAAVLAWPGLTSLYLQVWLVGFVINGLFMLIFRGPEVGPASLAKAAPKTIEIVTEIEQQSLGSVLANRLPQHFGVIYALRAEDHYVHVHGDCHKEMPLMRLGDAIAAMPDNAGVQVHRSWWVALCAIDRVEKSGRRLELVLVNGLRVPVSREGRKALIAQGWK